MVSSCTMLGEEDKHISTNFYWYHYKVDHRKCFVEAFGAHEALCGPSAGAYGWSDGLPQSLLSPPTPSFFLLLLLCWEMNSPPVCCICMSLWQTPPCSRVELGSVWLAGMMQTACESVFMDEVILTLCRLISWLQKPPIKSWSGCQFKWNEMEPESN